MYNNSNNDTLIRLISDIEKQVYDIVNYVIIIGVISLFGVVTNGMNLVVFYKQGFNNTMNISFFGLAISDLCGLTTLLWCGIMANPLLANSDLPIIASDIFYIAAASPHCIFVRTTGWITLFITAERCLCITLPLKIKQIVTKTTTTLTIGTIYLGTVATFIPEYLTAFLVWQFYPERNKTLIGITVTENRKNVEGVLYILHSILGLSSFIAVIVLTTVLVAQLITNSKWRRESKADKANSNSLSTRDKKAMKMVVMIATVLIMCNIPGVAASIFSFLDPEIELGGVNINVFFIMWSFVFIFDAINSSVNIFLYYRMSSKYRETFNHVFGLCTN